MPLLSVTVNVFIRSHFGAKTIAAYDMPVTIDSV